jgi:uncharacterized membrane protein
MLLRQKIFTITYLLFRKWDVGIWTGLGWLMIDTGGRYLWMR